MIVLSVLSVLVRFEYIQNVGSCQEIFLSLFLAFFTIYVRISGWKENRLMFTIREGLVATDFTKDLRVSTEGVIQRWKFRSKREKICESVARLFAPVL